VMAADAGALESDLTITVQGSEKHVTLGEALALLKVPSVSILSSTKAVSLSGGVAFEIRGRHRRHASCRTGQAQARSGRE
jgi:hypothetical protein